MYTTPKFNEGKLAINISKEGEPIEHKIERIISNKEPIKDGAPLVYTERKEGIRASTNIRTDRWEIAVEATEKIAKTYKAQREQRAKDREPIPGKDSGAESTQGKEGTTTNKS